MSLSYFGLRERTKFTKGWDISKYFSTNQNVFIDSGCSTINSAKEKKYTNEELKEIANHYYSWISDNIEHIELYTEFDSLQLGGSFIEENRARVRDIEYDKFIPIWHGEEGLDALRSLADTYGRVGILQTSINGRDIVPLLNRMARTGVKLHGLSMTKPDTMKAIPWESVSSTSWISPMQYGDTIIWSHGQLKRYPKSMKDQARKKERSVFMAGGFDLDKIYADDSKEMLRVSLWSWGKLLESINEKHSRTTTGVTTSVKMDNDSFKQFEDTEVGGVVEKVVNRAPTATPRDPSQKRLLPLMNFDYDTEKVRNKETNEMEDIQVAKLKIRSESMRICDTCFLATKCPMVEENSTCAYDIPITIRTKEQMASLMDSMVEMQAQRVLFMKMAEDIEGGMADPILSGEIDRLGKLMKTKHDMEQEGFSLTVTAKQNGQMDVVNRIFGDMTTKSFTALPAPTTPELTVSQMDIFDAEIEY